MKNWLNHFKKNSFRPHIEELNFNAFHVFFTQLSNPDSNIAFIQNSPTFQILKSVLKENLEIMTKQTILIRHFGTSSYRNNFMFNLTEEVTQYLIQAGIPQYMRQYVTNFHFHLRKESRRPKVFKIEDLQFGFEVWIVACGVATGVFVVEVLLTYLKGVFGLAGLLMNLKRKNVL